MADNLGGAMSDVFEEHRERIVTALTSGAAKSYEEYRYMTGQLKGAADLWRDIDSLLKRAAEHQEED